MDCPDADTLAALLGDALSEAVRAEVANHAASCESCHTLIEILVERVTDDEPSNGSLALRRHTLVGRYLIGEQLGVGGMGLVYAAVDTELLRRVAIKLLRPDRRGPSDGGERMLREAQTLARLAHPNVVTVFDVGTYDGHPFIAMELVDGGSLTDWVRGAPRRLEDRLDRMLEAARGLAAAHALGVVHRDVKPDNILVGTDGRARMTDFGLANSAAMTELDDDGRSPVPEAARLTHTGTLMGTPAYMAPEQVARERLDARTDQWSFCATLYEVIAGTRPFPVEDLVARSIAIRDGVLAAPAMGRVVPAWVRQIVARGLREDPAERWASMDEVVHALGRGRRRKRQMWIGGLAIAPSGIAIALAMHFTAAPAPPPKNAQLWVDMRSGCNCPFSACDGTCVSVCRASDFPIETLVPGVNGSHTQEALLGASRDGTTLLYLTGKRCSIDRLMLARRHGATFDTFDLTDQLDRNAAIFEGCCTLAPDGASVIVATEDRKGFVRWQLHGTQLVRDNGAELLDLLPLATDGKVGFPVLANDELTLYYRFDEVGGGEKIGTQEGSYAAVRAAPHLPFHPGSRLGGRARLFEYITGVSSDGLSLFMASEFETRVLVRTQTTLPFGDPGYTLHPARLHGWRAIPLEDCNRIVTTTTPGGCEGEDIVWLDAAN